MSSAAEKNNLYIEPDLTMPPTSFRRMGQFDPLVDYYRP